MPERRFAISSNNPIPKAFKQVAEVQASGKGPLRRTRKAAHRLHLVEQILHARIAQVVEQLHTMNPQHHPKRIGAAATASFRTARSDPPAVAESALPSSENLPARPPLLRIVLQLRESLGMARSQLPGVSYHETTPVLFRASLRSASTFLPAPTRVRSR